MTAGTKERSLLEDIAVSELRGKHWLIVAGSGGAGGLREAVSSCLSHSLILHELERKAQACL